MLMKWLNIKHSRNFHGMNMNKNIIFGGEMYQQKELIECILGDRHKLPGVVRQYSKSVT